MKAMYFLREYNLGSENIQCPIVCMHLVSRDYLFIVMGISRIDFIANGMVPRQTDQINFNMNNQR